MKTRKAKKVNVSENTSQVLITFRQRKVKGKIKSARKIKIPKGSEVVVVKQKKTAAQKKTVSAKKKVTPKHKTTVQPAAAQGITPKKRKINPHRRPRKASPPPPEHEPKARRTRKIVAPFSFSKKRGKNSGILADLEPIKRNIFYAKTEIADKTAQSAALKLSYDALQDLLRKNKAGKYDRTADKQINKIMEDILFFLQTEKAQLPAKPAKPKTTSVILKPEKKPQVKKTLFEKVQAFLLKHIVSKDLLYWAMTGIYYDKYIYATDGYIAVRLDPAPLDVPNYYKQGSIYDRNDEPISAKFPNIERVMDFTKKPIDSPTKLEIKDTPKGKYVKIIDDFSIRLNQYKALAIFDIFKETPKWYTDFDNRILLLQSPSVQVLVGLATPPNS
jgi:hypothetical protein